MERSCHLFVEQSCQTFLLHPFLAKVNLRSRLLCYMLSPVRLSVVGLSSVTFVHPTQRVKITAMFLCHLVPWPSIDIHGKFYEDRPRGTPPSGGLNARGVAKYSDFAAIEGNISTTVQYYYY